MLIHKRKGSVAKCWGGGTELLLFDGRRKRVEEIGEGDMLMGDDGRPRKVQPGSLFSGHTAEDAAMHEAEGVDGPTPAMYRIDTHHAGKSSWTCNGEHTLVLRLTDPPSPIRLVVEEEQPWQFDELKLRSRMPYLLTRRFATEREAQTVQAACISHWQPLEWECTVDQFLQLDVKIRERAQMFQPAAVQFAPPARSLQQRLAQMLPSAVSSEQLAQETAWALGYSLGRSHCSMLPSISAEVGLRVARVSSELSAVAESFGLAAASGIPHDLLRESQPIRAALLAGLIDAVAQQSADASHLVINTCNSDLLAGIMHLARSLGFNARMNDTGMQMRGDDLNRAGLPTTRSLQLSCAKSSSIRAAGFSITPIPHAAYYGFSVDGNGRVLLTDFTVSHNSIYNFDGQHSRQSAVGRITRNAAAGGKVLTFFSLLACA